MPLTLAFAYAARARKGSEGKRTGASVPWFIPCFVGAVIFRALFPAGLPAYVVLGHAGKAGLNGAIFLISSQMSRAALRRVGPRPLGLAVCLWLVVIAGTLSAIYFGWMGGA